MNCRGREQIVCRNVFKCKMFCAVLCNALPTSPLNINMLHLHTYVTDYTHTNYIRKNIIGGKKIYLSLIVVAL